MTISSTTSTSSASATGSTSLKQQLADLQKQLTTESQSKDDAKTKETKEAAIQLQIQQIEAQMAKAKDASSGTAPTASQAPAQDGLPTYA